MDIAVVDYGMGNLRSVAKALRHVAPERTIVVSSDPTVIGGAGRVVLPDDVYVIRVRKYVASGVR